MALFSIFLGAIFFLISTDWFGFVAMYSQVDNPGSAFGFIWGVFPALFGMLLVVPNTVYRATIVFIKKPKQTMKEKVTLIIGLLITLLYIGAPLALIFT